MRDSNHTEETLHDKLHSCQKELNDAKRRLWDAQRILQRKDEFLAMLSHELRTPLATLSAAHSILRRHGAEASVAAKTHEVMARQIEQMRSIIDDLLDISRIAAGKLTLNRTATDLRSVASTVIEDHLQLQPEGISLQLTVPDCPVEVFADRARIRQAIGNLVQNAVKFTEAPGDVSVTLGVHDDMAEIRVKDTGVGIEPEQLCHLFEPYRQAPETANKSAGGIGLGLALVQAVTHLHDGRVLAHSDGPGRGAEFIVRLPLLDRPITEQSLPPSRPTQGEFPGGVKNEGIEHNNRSRTNDASLPEYSETPRPKRCIESGTSGWAASERAEEKDRHS